MVPGWGGVGSLTFYMEVVCLFLVCLAVSKSLVAFKHLSLKMISVAD